MLGGVASCEGWQTTHAARARWWARGTTCAPGHVCRFCQRRCECVQRGGPCKEARAGTRRLRGARGVTRGALSCLKLPEPSRAPSARRRAGVRLAGAKGWRAGSARVARGTAGAHTRGARGAPPIARVPRRGVRCRAPSSSALAAFVVHASDCPFHFVGLPKYSRGSLRLGYAPCPHV